MKPSKQMKSFGHETNHPFYKDIVHGGGIKTELLLDAAVSGDVFG